MFLCAWLGVEDWSCCVSAWRNKTTSRETVTHGCPISIFATASITDVVQCCWWVVMAMATFSVQGCNLNRRRRHLQSGPTHPKTQSGMFTPQRKGRPVMYFDSYGRFSQYECCHRPQAIQDAIFNIFDISNCYIFFGIT